MCALVLGDEQAVAFLNVESLIPGINHRQSTVYASDTRRMYIGREQISLNLRRSIARPYASIGKEETLCRRKAVFIGQRTLFHLVLQSTERNVQPAVVSDILAERLLAVYFLAGQYLEVAEMIYKHFRPKIKILLVSRCPPVVLITVLVEQAALIVKSVAHFVTDHGPDGPVIGRIINSPI